MSNTALFQKRGASILAVSVDSTALSAGFAHKLGITFPLLSDPDLKVISRYGLRNPEVDELALHSVYLLGRDRRVLYRKVALARPLSKELLDALDYTSGRWPTPKALADLPIRDGDGRPERMAKNAAYWHASGVAAGRANKQPTGLEAAQLKQARAAIQHMSSGNLDSSIAVWRRLAPAVASGGGKAKAEEVRSWILREAFLSERPWQRALLDRLGAAKTGTPAGDAVAKELQDLNGPRWGPLEAMFAAQRAFDYVLEHLP